MFGTSSNYCIFLFQLLTIMTLVNTTQGKASCSKITCEEPVPKDDAKCVILPEDDESVPRPSGRGSKCCPLWKCVKGNGDFYTAHDGPDGREIVQYSKNGRSVTSHATGNHDALANAGGNNLDIQEALDKINKALISF